MADSGVFIGIKHVDMRPLLRLLVVFLIIFAFGIEANADPITRQQAQKRVQDFLEKKGKSLNMSMGSRAAINDQDWNNSDSYYIFNIGDNEGYVIAAGNDCVPAILGYSDSGHIGDSIPDNMKAWLNEYADQITYMQELGITSNVITSIHPAISPLLTTIWGQGNPYNINCPDFFTYGKCVTGCVATAMAQVMYYHRAKSVGKTTTEIPAYMCGKVWSGFGRVSVSGFPAGSEIDWGNMLNSYTGTTSELHKNAVANLMAYCGASVKMEYRNALNGGSGAYSEDVPIALKKYFDYSEHTTLCKRANYNEEQWDNLIYTELSKGNPIYYSGQNSSAGHAFVCDGYDGSGYYHINWGWTGTSDGFFLLSVLDPQEQGIGGSSSGYNLNQSALIGAQPNGEIIKLFTQSFSITSPTSYSVNQLEGYVTPSFQMTLKNYTDNTFSFENAIGLYNKRGDLVEIIKELEPVNNLPSGSHIDMNFSLDIRTDMTDGVYYLKPLSRHTGESVWHLNNNSKERFITLVVKNGSFSFYNGTPPTNDDVINFEDNEVKRICVENWDTDGDYEISYEEAAAVTSFGTVFNNSSIKTFDEAQYFTGIQEFGLCSWLGNCSSLISIQLPSSVTTIKENAFYGCSSLTSISLPSTVERISGSAFVDCNSLNAIALSENLVSIGTYAFLRCSSLNSIEIPASVTVIGDNAFGGCTSLNDFVVNSANSHYCSIDGVLFTKDTKSLVQYPAMRSGNYSIPSGTEIIRSSAFYKANIESIDIPSSVTKIGNSAFMYCNNLTEATIPSSVVSIGNELFYGCSSLESAVLPDGISQIPNAMFINCHKLTSIILPTKIAMIGSKAFGGCWKLTEIDFPSTLCNIGSEAFKYSGLKRVSCKKGAPPTLGSEAFLGINSKAELYVPKDCKSSYEVANGWKDFYSIEETEEDAGEEMYAVYNDGLLTFFFDNRRNAREGSIYELNTGFSSPTWLENKTTIKEVVFDASFSEARPVSTSYWFYGCSTLESIKGMDYLNTINVDYMDYMFSGCSSLTVLNLGMFNTNNASSSSFMFNGCNSLKILIISNPEPPKLLNSFYSKLYTQTTLYVPVGCKEVYKLVNNWGDFTMIEENTNISFADSEVKSVCVENWDTNNDKELNYSELIDVTDIGSVFSNNQGITSFDELQYFYGLKNIDSNAFNGCSSLTTISIPICVTSINKMSFINCPGLASIIVDERNQMYDSRNNCNAIIKTSDNTLIAGCKNTVVPDNVVSIGDYAFYGSGLTAITLHNNITNIGTRAFYGCASLTTIEVTHNTPLTIESDLFSNQSNVVLYVPYGAKTLYEAANYWKDFKDIVEFSPNIVFADAAVKQLCLDNWDTNSDGVFSSEEAAAVTDLGEVFRNNSEITTFNELQFFTGLNSIGPNAFRYCTKLTSVAIPSGVTTIGNSSFYDCIRLTSITIPSGIANIGNYAFYDCSQLKSVYIPSTVTSIGNRAFQNCKNISSIIVNSDNPIYDSRNNCNAIIRSSDNVLIAGCKSTIIPNNIVSIGDYAFYGISDLTEIAIPQSVLSLGDYVFSYSGLLSITIPKSVTSIGSRVFSSCRDLEYLVVEGGNTVYDTRIGCNAIIRESDHCLMAGCKNTIIPSGVTSIADYAFYSCRNLSSISIPNTVTSIGRDAFYGCSLTSITIPSSISSIGNYAFSDCSKLTSVKVGMKFPTSISSNVFSNRANATLYVPLGSRADYEAADYWTEFKTIEEYDPIIHFADANVKAICVENWDTDDDGELSYEEASVVTNIGTVFKNSSEITSFDELQYFTGLNSIGTYAFYGCVKLSSIIIPKKVVSVGECAFELCYKLSSISIPANVTTIYGMTFDGCDLSSISVEEGNPVFDSRNDCNAIIRTSDNTLIRGCKNTVIPEDVTSIGSYAFFGCQNLLSLTIPNCVTSIGSFAFVGCEMNSITIPYSVLTIDGSAFKSCKNLSSIIVEDDNPVFDSRNGCNAIIRTSDNTLIRGCKNTIIPKGTTCIGDHAFSGCDDLKTIIIPNSVTSIGNSAFYLDSRLYDITIPSSVTSIKSLALDCFDLNSLTVGANIPVPISSSVCSLRRNVTLNVPYGSKESYETADYWNEFKEIVEYSTSENISILSNSIYIESLEGRKGGNTTIKVKLKNAAAVTSYGFDLVLPEGMSITTDVNGGFDSEITRSSRHTNHVVTTNKLSDNTYKVGVASLNSSSLTGNDGLVLTIKAQVDDEMAKGVYPIIIRNPLVVYSNGSKPDVVDMYSEITIDDYKNGDVDGDGVVDLADAVLVINHYVGKPVTNFNEKAADVDGDNVIDLADAVLIINYYVGKIPSLSRERKESEVEPQ